MFIWLSTLISLWDRPGVFFNRVPSSSTSKVYSRFLLMAIPGEGQVFLYQETRGSIQLNRVFIRCLCLLEADQVYFDRVPRRLPSIQSPTEFDFTLVIDSSTKLVCKFMRGAWDFYLSPGRTLSKNVLIGFHLDFHRRSRAESFFSPFPCLSDSCGWPFGLCRLPSLIRVFPPPFPRTNAIVLPFFSSREKGSSLTRSCRAVGPNKRWPLSLIKRGDRSVSETPDRSAESVAVVKKKVTKTK